MSDLEISVVIPVLDEADQIEETVSQVRAAVVDHCESFEIWAVDDGSHDDTWEVLQRVRKDVAELRGLRLSRNFGKEAALRAGLEHAKGRAVLLMDGDRQHPPEVIASMLPLWREGYQVVNAVKRRDQAWTSRVFNWLFARLAGTAFAGATDFKLLDRAVVDAYLELPERNVFLRGLVPWMGFRQTQVTFKVPLRPGGGSRWSGRQRLDAGVRAILSFSTVPLRLVTLAGLVFLLFAVILGAHTLWVKLSGGAVEGFATVILLILMTGSILMLSLGIIGEYLAKIYDEVKQRPRYFVVGTLDAGPERK